MKNFNLKDEITLIKFDNKKNIYGELILFKDNKIIGIMNKNDYEIFVVGEKISEKIWIHNSLKEDTLYNLSENTIWYKKGDIAYKTTEKSEFELSTIDFDIKKIDILNRKIVNHTSNINKKENNVNRALILKK